MKKKTNKKSTPLEMLTKYFNKPYDLKTDEGYVVELSKGCFIGKDGDGEFELVDDLCDGYCAVNPAEMIDSIDNYISEMGKKRGYPKLHYMKKSVRVYPSKELVYNG